MPEALIGAIYLDGGIESTRKVVLNWVEKMWDQLDKNISQQSKGTGSGMGAGEFAEF